MSKFDEALAEIRNLKVQMRDDFQFTAIAMSDMGQRTRETFNLVGRQIESLSAEMSERFNQVEGRMRLLDHRFGSMLQAVETSLTESQSHSLTPERFESLERRVELLEQQRPSAA